MIRPLTEADLPELAELRMPANARPVDRQRAHVALTELYPELYFRAPDYDPDLCGLVSVAADRQLTGMIGMGGRPMQFNGHPITAVIVADLYVAAAARKSLAGVALMQRLLKGPQDVTISDIANDSTRQLWERLGGFVASAWNINWVGVFRPSQLIGDMLQERRAGYVPGRLVKAMSPLVDRWVPDATKCKILSDGSDLSATTLTSDEFSQSIEELTRENVVQPVYSATSAAWMWQRLAYLSPNSGTPSAVAVRNQRGRLLGWYIYTLKHGGVARVAQIAARDADVSAIVSHLFARVQAEGAAAVAGRMQPRFRQALIDHGCMFRARQTHTLVHSRDPQIADAFRTGSAWLSVLEGEAPFNAWNQPAAAAADLRSLSSGPSVVSGGMQRFTVASEAPTTRV